MNSIFGFAMLYYTRALGLPPAYAGWAGLAATIFDAVSDPIMGHISDNTRSRFGKRHPYMFFGGGLMVVSFFFVWYVPELFQQTVVTLFWYLVVMNLLLRGAFTIFIVPYTALSFEICQDYAGRSKIQGIRSAMNMAANLLGPAMAHTVFFGRDTETMRAANIAQNYVNMGIVFAAVAGVLIILTLIFTAKYAEDSRRDVTCSRDLTAFFRNMKDIVLDKYPRWVFLFIFFVILGIVLISSLQMYVFEDFMRFSGPQRTIAHGATMVGSGLGALASSVLVRRFDKKGAIFVAVGTGICAEFFLASLFLTGFLEPDLSAAGMPLGLIVFTMFHALYWCGTGVMFAVSLSMMADITEINHVRTGKNKAGSYAAMYSMAVKLSIGPGMLLSGYCLGWVGFEPGAEAVQSPEVAWRIGAMMFLAGPLISLAALGLILKYPVNKTFIESLRNEHTLEQQQKGSLR